MGPVPELFCSLVRCRGRRAQATHSPWPRRPLLVLPDQGPSPGLLAPETPPVAVWGCPHPPVAALVMGRRVGGGSAWSWSFRPNLVCGSFRLLL